MGSISNFRCEVIEIAKHGKVAVRPFAEYLQCYRAHDRKELLHKAAISGEPAAAYYSGYELLIDGDERNDEEALNFHKQGILELNLDPEELLDYYSFVRPDIKECNFWASKKIKYDHRFGLENTTLFNVGDRENHVNISVNGWGASRFVKVTLNNGCFLPNIEVNNAIKATKLTPSYGNEVILHRKDVDGCTKFVNVIAMFHPDYAYRNKNGYITGSKFVNFNCGDDENISDFITGKKDIRDYLK